MSVELGKSLLEEDAYIESDGVEEEIDISDIGGMLLIISPPYVHLTFIRTY